MLESVVAKSSSSLHQYLIYSGMRAFQSARIVDIFGHFYESDSTRIDKINRTHETKPGLC